MLRGPGNGGVTYADLETASSVLLVGLEPEDEAGTIFLRLRKAARGRTGGKVYSLAPYTSRGLHKMSGTLIRDPCRARRPRSSTGWRHRQDVALDKLSVDPGRRAARRACPGALGGGLEAGRHDRCPRSPGSRAGRATAVRVEAGAPAEPAARRPPGRRRRRPASTSPTAWGVDHLPDDRRPGRRARSSRPLAPASSAASSSPASSLDDLADPDAAREAVAQAGFVVALEVRESEVTEPPTWSSRWPR